MPMFRVDLDFLCGTTEAQLTLHQVYVEAKAPRECTATALAYLHQYHAEKIQGHEFAGYSILPTPGVAAPGLRIKRTPSAPRAKVTVY